MGRKPLSYLDAVKLLGGDSRMVAGLSKIAGAGLAVISVGSSAALSLFDLKGEVERLGQEGVVTLRNRFMGLNRFKRSELLEAAHAVLVVSAFFAALDDLSEDLCAALNTASLELTKAEQVTLASGSTLVSGSAGLADLAREFVTPGAIPGLRAGWADRGGDLRVYYADLARRVRGFAAGTAVWDERDETTRSRWSATISDELPQRALIRYQERLGQLAGEFPEFAFWANRVGVQTVLEALYAARRDNAELGQALQTLAGLMQSVTPSAKASAIRSDLAIRYRDQLDKPIAGAAPSAIPDEVTLPHLRELYVNSSYRMLPQDHALADGEWISESTWQAVTPRGDLWALVLQHLISTDAALVPVMLLGQPGAGKSVSTQMLAAELDPRDYMVVRVELGAVPYDAGIQEQIECALAGLTGRRLSWPELADDAGDAQPVILLDGFDEFLRASQASHFNYLEQVQAFQEREASLGRPVAVLVTSRTAVADQVRYPDGTIVIRLEEFDDHQVGYWLDTWNKANPARPLPVKTALAQGELARQPILLFMLALFHSGGGALVPGISKAELYHQLFTSFVEREVTKTGTQLSDQNRRQEVRRELDLLSMVAFAMFNRGRQTVNEADLADDLAALPIGGQPQPGPEGRTVALTIAERMAGRFFFRLFMQRDQAIRGQQTTLSTYEFLHASFGEFLVARWVVDELRRLAELARRTADVLYRQPTDDGLLWALLSVAVLSNGEQRVLEFIAGLLTGLPTSEMGDLRTLVATLFLGCLQSRRDNPHPQYHPVTQTAPATYAAYSANLILILLLVAEAAETIGNSEPDGLTLTELYGAGASTGPEEQLTRFHAVTRLWHAQLAANEWDGLVDVIRLETIGKAAPEFRIVRWKHDDHHQWLSGRTLLPGREPAPASAPHGWIWLADPAGRALREATLLGSPGYQGACVALLPYLSVLGTNTAVQQLQLGHPAADMLAMLIASPWDMPDEQRANLYERLANFPLGLRQARMLLNRLHDDRHRFVPVKLARITATTYDFAWTNITAYLDILAYLYAPTDFGQPKMSNRRYLERLLDPLDQLGWASLHNRDKVLLDPRDPRDLNELFSWAHHGGHPDGRPSDLFGLPVLPDTRRPDLNDQRQLLVLRDLLGLKDLSYLLKLVTRREFLWRQSSTVVDIALWAEMARRGLPVSAPKELPASEQVSYMMTIVPNFVARIKRLAADRGYANPFPDNPILDEPTSESTHQPNSADHRTIPGI